MEGLERDVRDTESSVIDFLSIGGLFARNWYWILAGVALFSCIGVVVAMTTRPSYASEAVITPSEQQSPGGASLLGNLGRLGGVMAQLGSGNNNLIHLELLASSRHLTRLMIQRRALLPVLLNAKEPGRKPTADSVLDMKDAVSYFRDQCLSVGLNQAKKTIQIAVYAPDSTLAADLVKAFLVTLREKIQDDARAEADSNRAYLQAQMELTPDPLLKEKIMGLMSMELEKAMLVGSQPFQVIEYPEVPEKPEKPKRKLIVFLFALSGLGVALVSILLIKAVLAGFRRRS